MVKYALSRSTLYDKGCKAIHSVINALTFERVWSRDGQKSDKIVSFNKSIFLGYLYIGAIVFHTLSY